MKYINAEPTICSYIFIILQTVDFYHALTIKHELFKKKIKKKKNDNKLDISFHLSCFESF